MNRSTIILITTLLVLGVLAYFMLPTEKEREASYKAEEISVKIDSASVVKIELQRPGKYLSIENVGGKWTIITPVRYAADPSVVTQFLGGLMKFKVGSLISSNPEKQKLFQVDSSGTNVIVTHRSGDVVSMILGKMGPSFSEIYFRLPRSNDVYLGEGIDSWSLTKEVKEWRDKTILALPSEGIKQLSYAVGSKEYMFNHDSSGWKSGEKTIETSVMNPILTALANLRADDFIDSAVTTNARPVTLSIKGMENVTVTLSPSLPDSSKYFVHTASSPQIFVINKWTAQQLLKPVEKPAAAAKPVQQVAESKKEESKREVSKKEEPKKEEVKTWPPISKATPKKEAEQKPVTMIPPVKKDNKTGSATPGKDATKEPKKEVAKTSVPPKKREEPPVTKEETPVQPPSQTPSNPPPVKADVQDQPPAGDEDGELIVHTIKKGESMLTVAERYHVSINQIKKWNLLKSNGVKPGQELYIYQKKQ